MIKEEYLKETALCDFIIHPEIKVKALALAYGFPEQKDIFRHIFAFVKELPYGLDNWNTPASQTLLQGWGMCSGKTNLLVAMLRSMRIPTRYRLYQIMGDVPLWNWATQDNNKVRLVAADEPHDHVDCEVYLDKRWRICDPSRDTALEKGMQVVGLPLRRNPALDKGGKTNYLILASIDQWAQERQEKRKFRGNRAEVFSYVNRRLDEIRALGGQSGEGKISNPKHQ